MFLQRRARRWYLLHTLPPKVNILDATGKRKARFCISLKTEDRRVAERRAVPFMARWLVEIEKARNGGSRDALEEDARFYQQALLDAPEGDQRDAVLTEIANRAQEMAERAAERVGIYDDKDPDYQDPALHKDAERFYSIASGKLVRLDERLEDYLATLRITPKVLDNRRSRIKKVIAAFPFIADVQRRSVQEWINRQLGDGVRVSYIKRDLREFRGYWTHLEALGLATAGDVFDRLSVPRNDGKVDRSGERMSWTPADIVKLHSAAKGRGDQTLADLIELAMWTGARIDELCAMKAERVSETEGYLEIVDAKSAAGWRKVPIHSALKVTVTRLVKDSKDGYLLSGLNADKYGKRSNTISARFGRFKTALGYDKRVVFHSIRKTVATLLYRAGVNEGIAADILGHEKKSMTYGVYADVADLETKREAVEKLSYPR